MSSAVHRAALKAADPPSASATPGSRPHPSGRTRFGVPTGRCPAPIGLQPGPIREKMRHPETAAFGRIAR